VSDNDPWRKPDPGQPPVQPPPQYAPAPQYGPPPQYGYPGSGSAPQYAPAPQYGPPPQYGYPPYGPPGYQQPLPKRGGIKKLVWFLVIVGTLVLGGCGVGIYFLVGFATQNADAVNAYLADVKAQRYDAAYDRLCSSVRSSEPRASFVESQREAVSSGRGLTSYDITSSETNSTNGVTSRTASGDASFADGSSRDVFFTLRKENGKLCIASGATSLYRS
jgi:hypothetical protein